MRIEMIFYITVSSGFFTRLATTRNITIIIYIVQLYQFGGFLSSLSWPQSLAVDVQHSKVRFRKRSFTWSFKRFILTVEKETPVFFFFYLKNIILRTTQRTAHELSSNGHKYFFFVRSCNKLWNTLKMLFEEYLMNGFTIKSYSPPGSFYYSQPR